MIDEVFGVLILSLCNLFLTVSVCAGLKAAKKDTKPATNETATKSKDVTASKEENIIVDKSPSLPKEDAEKDKTKDASVRRIEERTPGRRTESSGVRTSDNKTFRGDQRKTWAMAIAKMKIVEVAKIHKEKVKGYQDFKQTYKHFDANVNLNRYADVRCIDSSRVVLKGRKSDYIHASWVYVPYTKSSYILTQGPLNETCSDFWAMCYQEKVRNIIMLCSFFEGDVEQCALYFPEKPGDKEKYGNMEVTFVRKEEDPIECVLWSTVSVVDTEKANSQPMKINHFYVPWWADQLAPDDPKATIQLYQLMKKINPAGKPIVVHCNSGVGRSATFVAIDYANVRLKQEPEMEMVEVIRELRVMRYQAIQSHLQWLFLHVCLLELYCQEGLIQRDAVITGFIDEFKKHADAKLQKHRKTGEEEKSKAEK